MPTTTDSEVVQPPGRSLRQRALSGVLWAALEKWMVRGSTLIGFIVLGNLLSPEQFGVVALAMTFITILTIVADAGFSTYLVQVQRLTAVTTSTAFYISVLLGAVLAGALWLAAAPLAAVLDAPPLEQVLPALAVSVLLAGLSSVPAALLQKELRFRELAKRQVLATALSVVAAIALAVGGAGVWALVGQTLVRSVISCAALWLSTDFRPRWAFSLGQAREMTSFGVQSMLVKLGTQARDQGEVFFIGVLAGTTALGFWTVATRIAGVVASLSITAVTMVSQPVFARLQGDRARLARALGTSTAMGALVLVPVLVALSLTSGFVVPGVFGDQWAASAGIAAVLALRTLLSSLSDLTRSALLATGHPGAELALTGVLLVVQIALVLVLADGDLVLLAAALTGWMVVGWPLRALVLRRLLDVPLSTFSATLAVVLAGGVAAGAVLAAQEWLQLEGLAYVGLVVALGAVVYLGAALLMARSLVGDLLGTLTSTLGRGRRSRHRA